MANPFEYREALWTILYHGDQPPPSRKPDRPAPTGRRGRRGRTPQAPPRPPPKRMGDRRSRAMLEDFDAQIAEIAARKTTELPAAES